jgi:ubiquinone/menaquinone biosynthesis C-methylase UbiE
MINSFKRFIKQFDKRRRFLNYLNKPSRFLDLGCGRGDYTKELRRIYPEIEIHGVDIIDKSEVPDFIIYKKINLDIATLPYPNDFFDAVIFTHVIEHLRHPFRLGSEINRVMKKGGAIYIETPNWTTMFVPSFGFKREQHDPFNFFDDPTHIKPWSKHGLFEFLYQSCNLRVKEVGTIRNWLRIPFDVVRVFMGFIKGNRGYIISAFWNLYGWCIYGIGVKD